MELYQEHGSLIYALPIKTKKKMHEYIADGIERKYPYCDYEYFPESEWNYGFGAEELTICEHEVNHIPFSSDNPAVTILTDMAKVDWPMAEGYALVCDRRPLSNTTISEKEEKELIPYACAKLRMTEMPKVFIQE